jgi:exocyst complex component 8
MAILHFQPIIIRKTHQLFDKYVDVMIKAIPTFSEYDTAIYPKEPTEFMVETERQQLALLSSISVISDDLLPMTILGMLSPQGELKEPVDGLEKLTSISREYKSWRHHIQHSLDKIRVHFCRQYVFKLNHLRKGKARLNAHVYLDGLEGDYLIGDLEQLPSLPFQVLSYIFFFFSSFLIPN